jgi:hypothetical protein
VQPGWTAVWEASGDFCRLMGMSYPLATLTCRGLGTEGETLVIIEPIAADLDLDEVEVALLRAAVGDYAAEAAVLLLANNGYWLARLRAAGLIAVEAEPVGGQLWARIEWAELDAALAEGASLLA